MDAKEHATEIVRKLVNAGYTAYFAGGWVRDYLMGHPSSDIDIATNAPPEKIVDLFPRTLLVGLAFGVVIVMIDGHQFEVSTFRKDIEYLNGRKPEKIELSSPEQDALRRDFTINGLFYDPLNDQIHDYVHGYEDIKKGIIRSIGDPQERFMEDRLRMIRAIRFSSRFNFRIDLDTQEAIKENADTLFPAVAMERIWKELSIMASKPHFEFALIEMHRLGLLPVIFPQLKDVHLNTIKDRVKAIPHFKPGTPTIGCLMELFPDATLENIIEILLYLHCSNQDIRLGEFLFCGKDLLKNEESGKPISDVDWVHFYAHPQSQLCLEICAAHYPESQKQLFLNKHNERCTKLALHIERVATRKPVVNAALLKEQGIPQGIGMGKLLKEAESISITQDLHTPASIINLLSKSQHWPKGE